MWLLCALGSAFLAGITAILAKYGVEKVDTNLATALRTIVVFIFSWLMASLHQSLGQMASISNKTFICLILSGIATGASWLFYFKALQLGDVNKVTPIDKSSTVLTMLMACFLLGEPLNILKILAMICIGWGTYWMIQKKEGVKQQTVGSKWLFYAIGSAVFASLTAILGKIGITEIDASLGTAIRTSVVLVMAWLIVFMTHKQKAIFQMTPKSWCFLILSGFTTGGSWLLYYRAFQTGQVSIVVPIDKLSILVTIVFSRVLLKEKLNQKAQLGLGLIVMGTLLLLI